MFKDLFTQLQSLLQRNKGDYSMMKNALLQLSFSQYNQKYLALESKYYIKLFKNKAILIKDNMEIETFTNEELPWLLKCNGVFDWATVYTSDPNADSCLQKLIQNSAIQAAYMPAKFPQKNVKEYHNNYIQAVTWEITERCNLGCPYCYYKCTDSDKELPWPELKKIANQIIESGALYVNLTGGEPLYCRSFYKLVAYLLKHKVCVYTVVSNGLLLNETFFSFCKKHNWNPQLHISFDGRESPRADIKTNEQIFHNIREAISKKFTVQIYMVNKTYQDSISKFRYLRTLPVYIMLNIYERFDERSITRKEIEILNNQIDWKQTKIKGVAIEGFELNAKKIIESSQNGPCTTPLRHPHISYDGKVFACVPQKKKLPHLMESLQHKTLSELYYECSAPLFKLFTEKCQTCLKASECSLCSIHCLFQRNCDLLIGNING